MKVFFKRKTLKIRHTIAKLLVPKLYEDWLMHGGSVQGRIPRRMILAAKKHFKNSVGLVGVEIGVFEGVNALSILNELPIKKLYLIDPYINTEFAMYMMKQRLKTYEQVKFIRLPSKNAEKELPFVDFVYIDGDHSYNAVKDDIRLYFDLIKPNGIIGGHDYTDVARAVNEFVSENKLNLNLGGNDWWIIKPYQ